MMTTWQLDHTRITPQGFPGTLDLYLGVDIDTRRIAFAHLDAAQSTDTVIDALRQAIERDRPNVGLRSDVQWNAQPPRTPTSVARVERALQLVCRRLEASGSLTVLRDRLTQAVADLDTAAAPATP